MGLDSVELLVTFENYFDIQVSDLEAEKIRSVQEMVDCIANHLSLKDKKTLLKAELFEKTKSILIRLGIADNSFSLSDKIFHVLNPDDYESWTKVSEELNLRIPKPFRGADTAIKKMFFKGWRPKYDWTTITVDQFIVAIYADNYEKLIDNKSIKNTFEILAAIIALTSNCLGVDIYEVQPHKRFVDDFGID